MTIDEFIDKYTDWLDHEDDLLTIHIIEEVLEDAKKLKPSRS